MSAETLPSIFGITSADKQRVGRALVDMMDGTGMATVAAAAAVIKLEEIQLKREEFEDKKKRLDEGRPTELIASSVDITLRLESLRRSLVPAQQNARSLETIEFINLTANEPPTPINADTNAAMARIGPPEGSSHGPIAVGTGERNAPTRAYLQSIELARPQAEGR